MNEIKIGNQIWMDNNLYVGHYRNGDEIPNVTDYSEWSGLSTGALCVYNHGYLYNWYAVTDPRGLAPQGWHVPSKTEFETLLANWSKTETECYDALINGGSSGFNALLGGYRHLDGYFYDYGISANFWSTTLGKCISGRAWYLNLYNNYCSGYMSLYNYQNGFFIRCIKD